MPELPPVTTYVLPVRSGSWSGWKVMFDLEPFCRCVEVLVRVLDWIICFWWDLDMHSEVDLPWSL